MKMRNAAALKSSLPLLVLSLLLVSCSGSGSSGPHPSDSIISQPVLPDDQDPEPTPGEDDTIVTPTPEPTPIPEPTPTPEPIPTPEPTPTPGEDDDSAENQTCSRGEELAGGVCLGEVNGKYIVLMHSGCQFDSSSNSVSECSSDFSQSDKALKSWVSEVPSGTAPLTNVWDLLDGEKNTSALESITSYKHPAALACGNLTYEGHSDWYLPAISELQEIVRLAAVNGAQSSQENFGFSIGRGYWSSTEAHTAQQWWAGNAYALGVYYNSHGVEELPKDQSRYVRCVRRL